MSSATKTSVPIGAGSAAGLGATLTGYLVLYLSHGDVLERSFAGVNLLLELLGTDSIPGWQVAGWLYFNVQQVPITASLAGRNRVTHTLVGPDGVSQLWYLLLPALLLAAGAVVAWYANAEEPQMGGIAGVSTVPAALLVAVVGVLATRVTVGDATVGPDAVTAVLVAGVVYPAVFGTAGGVVAARAR